MTEFLFWSFNGGNGLVQCDFPVYHKRAAVCVTQRSFTFDVLSACVFMYCCIFIICVYVYVILSVCKNNIFTEICIFVALLLSVHIQIFKNDGTSQNLCFSTEWDQCNTRFMLTAGFNLCRGSVLQTHFLSIKCDKNDSFLYLTNSTITMNLDRLRKRVRHYIDQVSRGSIFSLNTSFNLLSKLYFINL